MATGVLNNCGKNGLQKGGRYGCFFRGRKTACRSKPPLGIIIKKIIFDGDIESQGSNDVITPVHIEEKSLDEIAFCSNKSKVNPGLLPVVKIDPPLNSKPLELIASSRESVALPFDCRIKRKREESAGGQIRKRSRDLFSDCGSVDEYQSLNEISHGAYGIVYRVRSKKTGEIVAMKEEIDGLSVTSLREISILKSLPPHPSIISFKEVVVDDCDGVYIIMEYLENDLHRYIKSRVKHLAMNEVKFLMKQLIEGVKFLHKNHVMHRDLKPSNILVNNEGLLKICDFGLSRHFRPDSGLTSPNVVTLWYRAPELLLGAQSYSSALDMWSVGCIMVELVLKEALFRGRSEIDQLDKIFRILGTPNEDVWPGFQNLPGSHVEFVQQPNNLLRPKLSFSGVPLLEEAGFDLLNRLLTYDPAKRITAESALDHAWFRD